MLEIVTASSVHAQSYSSVEVGFSRANPVSSGEINLGR